MLYLENTPEKGDFEKLYLGDLGLRPYVPGFHITAKKRGAFAARTNSDLIPYRHGTITVQTPYKHGTIAVQSKRKYGALKVQSECNRSAIAVQSPHKHSAIGRLYVVCTLIALRLYHVGTMLVNRL